MIIPQTLTGSHKCRLKLSSLFLTAETPHGFECLTITVPVFLGNELDIDNAE